jgi:branched-chain amino acid transport system permease protein
MAANHVPAHNAAMSQVSAWTDHATAYWLQQALNASVLACLYVPLAVAYALLQGITNRIILSFGDIATFGSFAAISAALYGLTEGYGGLFTVALAAVSAMLAAGGLGRAAHALVFQPIMGQRSQAVMIASIGLSIALQEALSRESGGHDLWLPPLLGPGLVLNGEPYAVQVSATQIAVIALSVALVAGVVVVMRRTAAGRIWRAVAQNARLAQLTGIDTTAVFGWSFVAASVLASVAGWIVAVSYGGVNFAMGLVLGFKAMFAAIIGGFGTVGGAIVGGIFLATLETAWTATFPAAYRDVVSFGIIVFILVLRPEGLLGNAIRRESEE